MTISTELRRAGPFTGNGATTAFPFSFKVFAASDVAVTRADTQGAETALVLNSDFTVALNPDQDAVPGGTVTLAAPLASGHRLTVTSAVPNLQPTDITNNGGFYPRVIEDALDRHVAQIQQIDEKVDRALKVAVTSPLGDQALPSPVGGMLIGWNESNDGLKNYAPIGGTLLGQQLAAADGSSLVGFQQAGAGAVVRTAQDKMREVVSVKDFGAVGDGVADDTGAVQSAINVAGLLRKPLYIPSGIYRITAPLNLRIATASNADTLTMEGDGDLNSHIWLDSNAAAGVFTYDNGWTAANVADCSTTSGSGVVTTTGTFAGVAVAGGALAIAGLPVCNIVSVDSPTQITVDRTASATASGLTARVYNTVATAKNRLRLRNLYLTHSQAVTNKTSWHSGTAMHFNGVVNSEFENIRINGFTRGVDMLGGWINNFKKVLTSGCREGFYIELCTYLWVFERCATVNSGGAGNWAGMKLINGGGISLLSHIIEQDNIGLELQGVRGYSIHGGNIESVSYEYSVILKGLPWATTDERHWTQAGDIAGLRIYNSQGILMSNGVKGIRIRANVFELSNPAFAPNGQSWIRTTGESNLVKNVDESGNIFPAGYESITHILAPTGFPTLAMCQSITRDGMRYSSGAPYYGKYWQKGDRLFRLPGDVAAGSYDGWVCTAASSGADGSATWKQFGTVQA